MACVRDGGNLSWVGLPVTGAVLPMIDLFNRNITVRGGIAPTLTYMRPLLADMWDGSLDPSPIIDLRLPLADAPAAYDAMDRRGAVKAVLLP
jgi:threonine dehydrogenase-like Zn-dependent dehydrogenase